MTTLPLTLTDPARPDALAASRADRPTAADDDRFEQLLADAATDLDPVRDRPDSPESREIEPDAPPPPADDAAAAPTPEPAPEPVADPDDASPEPTADVEPAAPVTPSVPVTAIPDAAPTADASIAQQPVSEAQILPVEPAPTAAGRDVAANASAGRDATRPSADHPAEPALSPRPAPTTTAPRTPLVTDAGPSTTPVESAGSAPATIAAAPATVTPVAAATPVIAPATSRDGRAPGTPVSSRPAPPSVPATAGAASPAIPAPDTLPAPTPEAGATPSRVAAATPPEPVPVTPVAPAAARADAVETAIRLESATGQAPLTEMDTRAVTVATTGAAPTTPSAGLDRLVGPDSEVEIRTARPEAEAVRGRVVRGLSTMINQRGGTMTMRLDPPELGDLKVQMTLARGSVAAVFHTTTAEAQAIIEKSLATLRASLEQQGLHVQRLTVQPSPGGQDASLDDHAGDHGNHRPDAGGGESRGRREGDGSATRRPGEMIDFDALFSDLDAAPIGAGSGAIS